MVALFHAKSRTCINRFVKASRLNESPQSSHLCDRARLAAGREAADAYLEGCERRHRHAPEERLKKVETILGRVDAEDRAVLAVAEVSLAHAMAPAALNKAARGHIAAARAGVQNHMWACVEEELQVVETLFAQVAGRNQRPDDDVADGVQKVRDLAAEERCREILTGAQQHCARQLFGAAQVAVVDLAAAARAFIPKLSLDGRARVQRLVEEGVGLRLMAELGADQHAMESALFILRHGDAPAARNQLQVLAAQVGARPVGHPSHEDLPNIQRAIEDCNVRQSLSADLLALGRAQAAGDLLDVHCIAVRVKDKLGRLPEDLMTHLSGGVLTGLRAWDPDKSNMLVFARLLQRSYGHDLPNRRAVEDAIRALGALEGPAGPFSVSVGDAGLPVSTAAQTYAYPSLKARIAATSPRPQGHDAIITLRMAGQHMYFHSGNYTSGLADIIETTPHVFAEYAARAKTREDFDMLFDALGFTCVEAQLSALQQAQIDPLQEDMVGKYTLQQKCDEYLRVFHLKQIRKYASLHGLNPDGHREDIDAKADFTRMFFNAQLFQNYLQEKNFRVSPTQMEELMRYEIDVVGVLSA